MLDYRGGSDETLSLDALVTRPVDLEERLDVVSRQSGLEWQLGRRAALDETGADPLPDSKGLISELLRLPAKTGYMREIETKLAMDGPEMEPVKGVLRDPLRNFDLRFLAKIPDHVDPR